MALSTRANAQSTQYDPAVGAIPFTAASDLQLAINGRAVYIGTAGNLNVIMQDGSTVTFTGVLAGQIYPMQIQKVIGAGTTAAGLVLL